MENDVTVVYTEVLHVSKGPIKLISTNKITKKQQHAHTVQCGAHSLCVTSHYGGIILLPADRVGRRDALLIN